MKDVLGPGSHGLPAIRVISLARMLVKKILKFYRVPISRLVLIETHEVETLAVTKAYVCFYNPKYVEFIGIRYTAAVLVHELAHVLRRHHERAINIHVPLCYAKEWNEGADAEINDDQPPQLPLPPGCIMPETFGFPHGKLAEWYYAERVKQIREAQQQSQSPSGSSASSQEGTQDGSQGGSASSSGSQGGSQGGSQEGSQGGSQGASQGGSQGGLQSGSQDPGERFAGRQPGHGHCGSCSGHRVPGETADGRGPEGQGRSEAEQRSIRKTVAKEIQEAVSRNPGSVPGGWAVWAKRELTPPQVRWQDQLSRLSQLAVTRIRGRKNHDYLYPSRRQAIYGYGPGVPVIPRRNDPVPQVMFVRDTSGSMMSATDSRLVMSEAKAIFDALRIPIVFGCCDAQMQTLETCGSIEDALKLSKGGGGTDFRPIFAAAEKHRPRPHILIIATDGYGPAPATPPRGIETIWLLVNSTKRPASWGHVIHVDTKSKTEAA